MSLVVVVLMAHASQASRVTRTLSVRPVVTSGSHVAVGVHAWTARAAKTIRTTQLEDANLSFVAVRTLDAGVLLFS